MHSIVQSNIYTSYMISESKVSAQTHLSWTSIGPNHPVAYSILVPALIHSPPLLHSNFALMTYSPDTVKYLRAVALWCLLWSQMMSQQQTTVIITCIHHVYSEQKRPIHKGANFACEPDCSSENKGKHGKIQSCPSLPDLVCETVGKPLLLWEI